MASISSLPAFLDELRLVLLSRSELRQVPIFTGPMDDENLGLDCLVVGSEAILDEAEYPTVPMVECFETYQVSGYLRAYVDGAAEDAIKAARDRAFVMLQGMAEALADDDTMGDTVDDVHLMSWSLSQRFGDACRIAHIDFTVRVRAHFTPE